ncbi:MAG: hypothetical protein IJU48_07545 [Synergistaceae bacterium]|nr:hypothetical protein [Synergistaceae bacterium]
MMLKHNLVDKTSNTANNITRTLELKPETKIHDSFNISELDLNVET